MKITNACDIFGRFFDVKFFILENIMPLMPLRWFIKHACPSFDQQDIHNRK